MTSIYLVRHGQASFGKKDYDNLSEIGEKQSFLLGEHFIKLKLNGITPRIVGIIHQLMEMMQLIHHS